jgi:hypothetical protein
MFIHSFTQAATSPALYYPGFSGGGIFHGGKLCCSRTIETHSRFTYVACHRFAVTAAE